MRNLRPVESCDDSSSSKSSSTSDDSCSSGTVVMCGGTYTGDVTLERALGCQNVDTSGDFAIRMDGPGAV